MNIRKFVFSILDTIKGGKTLKDLKDITHRVESGIGNNDALQRLLEHTSKTVQAYKDLPKEGLSLKDFPIVNKSILRENLDRHLSCLYDKESLTSTTTSGSTGTPFTIYFDSRKRCRHRAALMFWNKRAGAPLGQRLYYLRVWNNLNKKGKLTQLVENIIPVEVSHFSDNDINALSEAISNNSGPSAILGFSSAVTEFYRKCVDSPKNLKGIIAMSEHLPEMVRLDAQEKFRCPVLARYSNMENGFIAQQFDNSGSYLVNSADFVVEIFKLDCDEPAKEGEQGRIVVTDLFNYAMPFIRYDTGDIGKIITGDDGKIYLTSIEGRKSDVIYNTSGEIISSHSVTNTLWKFNEVIQFQFIQKGQSQYSIKLNMGGKTFKREAELASDLKKYLGSDATIEFAYVNEIPVLSSGKRRYIINEYSK